MPKIDLAAVPERKGSGYPPPFDVPCAERLARASNERFEQAGYGVRGIFTSVKALSTPETKARDGFGFGCGEFETVPATCAMSLCPAAEFPDERGRVSYFGTLLPGPRDIDWRPPTPEMMDASAGLVACVFGTTGLRTREEYEWLFSVGKKLAHCFADCLILVVIPEQVGRELTHGDCPRNLLLQPWIPSGSCWPVAKAQGPRDNTGGWRVSRNYRVRDTNRSLPRQLDQFGAAARVEYFGVGSALVSHELPEPELVARQVAHALQDPGIRMRTQQLRQEVIALDTAPPLNRFTDESALA